MWAVGIQEGTKHCRLTGNKELTEMEEEEEEEGESSKEKKKDKRKQWWKPWVDHASMVRSGNYYLFETNSEEEEEDEDKKDEEPPKRSAFQFVYHAWITDSKTAMKEQSKEKRRFWQRYTERSTNKKDQKDVHVAIEEGDQEEGVTEEEVSEGPDNILKRVLNMLKFSWVLFLTLLDSFTAWLNSIGQEHIDISTVLRIERCMLTHEVKKGNTPSRDSIHTYYQRQMCTASSLDRTEDECSDFSPLRSQAGENLSSMLYESTLDQPEETSERVLKTSQRARPRLCRLPSVDVQSSSADSAVSAASSELYSRQGTSDTVEEHPDKLWSSTSELPPPGAADIPPSYSKATGLDSAGRTEGSGRRLRIQTPDDEKSTDTRHQLTASELLQSRMFYDEELEASERFYRCQPQVLQLCYALYNMLVAHSEMVCYLVIILNHMISASVATLVLPILIFLWAMLSVPRPSKRFWMTAIVYTEVTIVIKYFFQFGFFPFNQSIELDRSKPFHPPNIIGVEKKEGYVHYDLVQLLALFFHRSILKCYGLWDEDEPRSGGQISDSEEKSAADVSPVRLLRKPLHSSSAVRRQSSSVSQRSKAGSSGTRTSVRSLSAQQKSRKELLIDKLREQLIKAKRFTIKT